MSESSPEEIIRAALREVIDPEVGMNVVDLGLIYGIEAAENHAHITMTMTTPACPMGSYLTDSVREAAQRVLPEAGDIKVDLVWDPPWSPRMMSDHARKHFGWSGG
jgi:metal-sulfur cluster biosynthetic enzyme